MSAGVLLVGDPDPALESRVKSRKLQFKHSLEYSIPFEKSLIVSSGVRIPWDLLPAAWNFLNRWDAAVPLWRYGVTASDLGSAEERKITKAIVRDLRVLVYSHELLFVRKNEHGSLLIETWKSEIERGADLRLAFLRAYYLVKPVLCVLPISWLAEVRDASVQSVRASHPRIGRLKKTAMIRVEISPGRFVKCHRDDVERVRAMHQKSKG